MSFPTLWRHPEFAAGARETRDVALGIGAWGLVAGVAMSKAGLGAAIAIAMSLCVFAGSAQLAALPLMVQGAPLWVIWATAFCVNLRFVIFSAGWRPYLRSLPRAQRLFVAYFTVDFTYIAFMRRFPAPGDVRAQTAYVAGNVSVGWITFQNGVGEGGTNAVALTPYAGWEGTLLVENNVFRNLEGRMDSGYTAIQLDSDLGRLEVRNNLFVNNTTESGISPLHLIANSTDFSYVGRFTNNTVTANQSGSYAVTATGGGIWSVANNVFWDNEGDDLALGTYVFLSNNDIGSFCCNPVDESGDISVDPGFVDPVGGNYRPGGSSPLAEAGRNDAPGGVGTFDLGGGLRMIGGTVDIGAYERQDALFGDGFDSL